ncbi:MAG: hypothetical protein ACYDBJ_07045 [Aggregatilineales bacterium]
MNQINALQSADRVSLRPLTTGQAIGRTLAFYRRLPVSMWILIVVVTIPLVSINTLANQNYSNALTQVGIDLNTISANGTASLSRLATEQLTALTSKVLGPAALLILVALAVAMIHSILVDSVLIYATSETLLGRTVGIGAAFAAVRNRLFTLVAGQILFYLILGGLLLGTAPILFGCGLVFGVLAFLYVAMGFLLSPVIILERVSVTQALGRAWRLGRTRFWPLIAMLVVPFAFSLVLGLVFGFIDDFLLRTPSISLGVTVAVSSITAVLISPFLPIGLTILYFDARVRSEGFGEAIQVVATPDPRPADVLPPIPVRSGFTSNDWINLALVTVGVIVLALIFSAVSVALAPTPLR